MGLTLTSIATACLLLAADLNQAEVVPDQELDLHSEAAHALPMIGVPPPPGSRDLSAGPRPKAAGDKILFVNFDGGQMNNCGGGFNNDPHNNCSGIFQGTVLPYSGNSGNRAAVIQVVRQRLADFGISVTNERPASGAYDMEMVGNWQGVNPDFAGIAPSQDCWDNNPSETSFTLEVSTSTDGVAEIMLQELAHTWGLSHVNEQQDLLYPTTEGVQKTFRDECYQIVSDIDLNPTTSNCSHHQQACGNNSQQNSYAELLLIFGPSVPDTTAPTVQILEPSDGTVVQGGDLTLRVGMEDNERPAVLYTTITLDSPALPEPNVNEAAFASPTELSFPITKLPDGTYTLRVEVDDESDNMASDEIEFTIEGSDVVPGGSSGSAGTGRSEGGQGSASEGSASQTSGTDPTDEGGGKGEGATGLGEAGTDGASDSAAMDEQTNVTASCACVTHPNGGQGPLVMLGLGTLLLLPRRRTRG